MFKYSLRLLFYLLAVSLERWFLANEPLTKMNSFIDYELKKKKKEKKKCWEMHTN